MEVLRDADCTVERALKRRNALFLLYDKGALLLTIDLVSSATLPQLLDGADPRAMIVDAISSRNRLCWIRTASL